MSRKLLYATGFLLLVGLAQVQAQDIEWIRAAWWDGRYPTNWADEASTVVVRDGVKAAGYEILDSDQLKTWMQARIADKKYSVVVFCRDIPPDTVCETMSASCTLRKYLDAGGKIVFYADIPFYNQGHADGSMTNWAEAGANSILGIGNVSVWDSNTQTKITAKGIAWGLTTTWASVRPYATTGLTVLATDAAGNAAAWVKFYAKNDTFRGFVRLWDVGGHPPVEDIIRAAEYVSFKASNPSPANGAVGVTMPLLTWDASAFGLFHDVYFGTTPELTEANLVASHQMFAMFYYAPGLESGATYYWRIDEVEANGTIRTGDLWHFMTEPLKAYLPSPADGATGLLPGMILSWSKGKAAVEQHVFFGPDEMAVANGDASVDKGNITETTLNTGALRSSTTYYWRVDTVKSDGTEKGDVWSFTTVDGGPANKILHEWWTGISGTAVSGLTGNENYPANPTGREYVSQFEGFVDWGDNYGDRLYGWLKPPQTGDYTFWVAGDDETQCWLSTDTSPSNAAMICNVAGWTPSRDFDNTGGGSGGASQKSAPITLQAGQKYFLMGLHKEGGGGDSIAVAWQGPGIASREIIKAEYVDMVALPPLQAFRPLPANGAVDVIQAPTLSWSAGEKATQHQIYLGDDANAVATADASSSLFKGSQAGTSFDTGDLEWNKTYYWRVDEVADGDPESPWKGPLWSFTTANFIPVDNFESYTDEEGVGARIYETWIDGLANNTGSTVGYWDPPFAERTIVHGGKQSMPMDYNNINTPYYSEAEREFDPIQNWKVGDVTDLSLFVRGNAARLVEDPPGQYTISANSVDVWGTADNFRFVYKTLNGDGSISAKVISMTDTTSTWAKAGVMIRESLSADSSYAFMFPTPDGRRAFQDRPGTAASAISAHSATGQVTLPFWVKVERKGSQFTAYYSTDGKNWTKQPDTENTGTDASPNPQTIAMTGSVRIGLAVASNNAQGGTCFAEFSDVVATGSVSGQFQVADIGTISPGNDPAALYVAVEDSSGKVAVVTNPDTGLVNVLEWTEWKIPLSDLAGVNLSKVKKMYIGVGDRKNPVQDGGGRIYIDDIRVTKP